MNKKQFSESLKEKTIKELLVALKQAQSGQEKLDPDFIDSIIEELNSRKLSKAEESEFENLLNFVFDDNSETDQQSLKKSTPIKESETEFSKEEIKKLTSLSDTRDNEPGRYTALKTVSGLISILGYIVIVIGIVGCVFLSSQGQTLIGIVTLIVSVILALPLIAFSNLIYVVIDTEYNTRKTRESLGKLQTKK